MKDYQSKTIDGIEIFQDLACLEAGIDHGFIGTSMSTAADCHQGRYETLQKCFNSKFCFLLDQVHGNDFVELSSKEELEHFQEVVIKGPPYPQGFQSDAIILKASALLSKQSLLMAIVTADCLPILVKCEQTYALIHAGWRGLALGIIPIVLKRLLELNPSSKEIRILIGPCAGAKLYEVGPEVIREIGPENCVCSKINDKFLLDLAASASRQCQNACSGHFVEIRTVDICTISNAKFFSYRRDNSCLGRNISYLNTSEIKQSS